MLHWNTIEIKILNRAISFTILCAWSVKDQHTLLVSLPKIFIKTACMLHCSKNVGTFPPCDHTSFYMSDTIIK